MARLNKVELIGNLGQKPELRTTTTNGVPVCNLRVAINESWTDKNSKQKREKTVWITVVCYRDLAERCVKFLDKGRQVYVEGRWNERQFLGQARYPAMNEQGQIIVDEFGNIKYGNPVVDGNGQAIQIVRTAWEVIADDVQFLGKKPENSAYAQPATPQQQQFVQPPATTPIVNAAGNPAAPANAFVVQPSQPAQPAQTVQPQFVQGQANAVQPQQVVVDTSMPAGV